MNKIKKLREDAGLTQRGLAIKTGLSLRTIQRLEASDKQPKGHSLSVLSEAFNVDRAYFQEQCERGDDLKEDDRRALKFINLSTLAFFGLPFGNLIVPFIVWKKGRKTPKIDKLGRQIINVQIIWSFTLYLLLCISPFLNVVVGMSFPLILISLMVGIIVNLIIVGVTAHLIQENRNELLRLPISLI